MKNLFVFSLIVLISLRAFTQDEGAEQTSGSQDNLEVPVGTTETPKIIKPKGRLRTKGNSAPAESSSYIGDPDNIDPLNPNRDNLKDDNEPILEDIKDVLNAKKKKKVQAAPPEVENAKPESKQNQIETAVEPPPPVIMPEKKEEPAQPVAIEPVAPSLPAPTPITETPPAIDQSSSLTPDQPDLELEKKFHDIYKRYNINPTSDDIWSVASGKQKARLYEVQKGDNLWSISNILFGDPNFWPKLWALNKQGILNPHFINPKMKIYFYEGNNENSPTLTVGENKIEEPSTTPEDLDEKDSESATIDKGEDATKVNLQADLPLDPKVRVERRLVKEVGSIPSSLPDSINERYYGLKKKKEFNVRIDFGEEPKSEFFYNNDIVITDVPARSDIDIKLSEVQKMRCYPGRLLKEIEFTGSLLTEYDIYEKIEGIDTVAGYKHTYRFSGRAKSYQDKYLRVTDCKSFIGTELILLPRDRMKELATQAITDAAEVKLIGGPDISQQIYYSTLQYAFVDFGPKKFSVGQEFKTISELTDRRNGEFKVVEKFGSLAVVVITNVTDQLSIGDRVEVQTENSLTE